MAARVVSKNRRATLERIEKFISPIYFADVNLFGRLYPKSEAKAILAVDHYAATGRIGFEDLQGVEWIHVEDELEGKDFGPTWSTHWFRIDIRLPSSWNGCCVVFRWNSGCEAMVWDAAGNPVLGLSEKNTEFILSQRLTPDDSERVLFFEMACNTLFGAGKDGFINAPDPDRRFIVARCDAVVKDLDVNALLLDLTLLLEIVRCSEEKDEIGMEALYAGNEIINVVLRQDFSLPSLAKAHAMATEFFGGASCEELHAHRIHAVGNCHIDTAWLWPYQETERKAGRSFASAVHLMSRHPRFKFVASQAVQLKWVKTRYPKLFERIKRFNAEGRFVPVGGTWVEMDGNLPSGESFCRQFMYGQRFFEREFGHRCKEFWLPDTFGYSAQLPQIMRMAEINRFLSQKLSWSLVNKFPHSSFVWEGIDGSDVLAHFPPGDSYEMRGETKELLKTVANNSDKGRVKDSLYLYGHGDGGGGPTEEMLERLDRLAAVPALPFRVNLSTPEEFFFCLEKSRSKLCRWTGELYLELHQGTFTTQAMTKRRNRQLENRLREAEFVATCAYLAARSASSAPSPYPQDDLEAAWKIVLLNQFHDVLPGSSIGQVYTDAMKLYDEAEEICDRVVGNGLASLVRDAELDISGSTLFVFNPTSFRRRQVVPMTPDLASKLSLNHADSSGTDAAPIERLDTVSETKRSRISFAELEPQQVVSGAGLILVAVDPFSLKEISTFETEFKPVFMSRNDDEDFVLTNGLVTAVVTRYGLLKSMRLRGKDKDAILEGRQGNELLMYDDVPLYWDAWDVMDYHLETEKIIDSSHATFVILCQGPLRAAVRFSYQLSENSHLSQVISLDAESPYVKFDTKVHWAENRKFLKVRFPLNVRSFAATYEIQYGHLQRSTTPNTSWDWAKYEVCGHRFADLSEHGFGVSLLNDSKYGHSVLAGNVLHLSLLRAPKAPDPDADMGVHNFSYALMPHAGDFQSAGVVSAAYAFNSPMRVLTVPSLVDGIYDGSLFSVSPEAVVIDCVKKSDFCDGILLRLYESFGSTVEATIKINATVSVSAIKCVNLLESQIEDQSLRLNSPNSFSLKFNPFKVKTVILIII